MDDSQLSHQNSVRGNTTKNNGAATGSLSRTNSRVSKLENQETLRGKKRKYEDISHSVIAEEARDERVSAANNQQNLWS